MRQFWSRAALSRATVFSSTCQWYRRRSSPCWLLLVSAPFTRSSSEDSPPRNSLPGSTMPRYYMQAYLRNLNLELNVHISPLSVKSGLETVNIMLLPGTTCCDRRFQCTTTLGLKMFFRGVEANKYSTKQVTKQFTYSVEACVDTITSRWEAGYKGTIG